MSEVHDLHVWEVTSGFPALSAHVLVGESTDCHAVSHALKELLYDEFDIEDTTLQVEHEKWVVARTLIGLHQAAVGYSGERSSAAPATPPSSAASADRPDMRSGCSQAV